MSDYEEEHFPVTMRTSFSSSFDTDWHESVGGADFAPIRRSFSEFYRGERMTVDTVSRNYGCEFQNASSKSSTDEIQNSVDDSSDLDNFSGSSKMKLGSGSSCVTGSKNSVHSDLCSRPYQSEVDMQIDSFISEHCSISSECVNGYDSRDANSRTQVVSHVENNRETVDRCDSVPRSGLVKEFAKSQHGSSIIKDVIHQRIVSEIRNNIPDVGNVTSCSDSGSEVRQPSPDTLMRGEFARFRKRSPGVAKRLEATTPSQGESVDMSVLLSSELCEAEEAAVMRCNAESSSLLAQPSTLFTGNVETTSRMNVSVPAPAADAERTSVLQAGEHCEDSTISQLSRTWDSLSSDSAHRTDPFRYSGMLPDAVLFTTSDDPVADQTIHLSPELTECDSDNVSTLEDDSVADMVNGCLPVVEDGLSCSDTDEMHTSTQHSSPPSNFSSAAHSDIAEADISHKFPVSETEVMDFFSGTTDNNCDTTRAKDDPVERAIRDIRLAMERSKGFAAGSPRKSPPFKSQSSSHDVETVWVSRAV